MRGKDANGLVHRCAPREYQVLCKEIDEENWEALDARLVSSLPSHSRAVLCAELAPS